MMYRCCVFLLVLFTLQRAFHGTACATMRERDFNGPLDKTEWNVGEKDGYRISVN